jgi:hypothetical protein
MSVWCSGRGGFARVGGHRFEPQQQRRVATLLCVGGWASGVPLLNKRLLAASTNSLWPSELIASTVVQGWQTGTRQQR